MQRFQQRRYALLSLCVRRTFASLAQSSMSVVFAEGTCRMKSSANVWAIVLAAGEGSRLRSLTTPKSGRSVPKQFCSLRGGPTLLEEAIDRASRVVAPARICSIVAERHQSWWRGVSERLPAGNTIVQPANRGTGIGILYSVMYVLARDPRAQIVLLPADHFVRDESLLESALQTAVQSMDRDAGSPVLIGMQPEEADPELGYIVPGPGDPVSGARVQRFVEKPSRKVAQQLVQQGALWNTFIIAAGGQSLLDTFFAQRFAMVMAQMKSFLRRTTDDGRTTMIAWSDLASIYQRFPVVDFSADILAGREAELRVVRAPACGWTDLGTPQRVAAALQRLQAEAPSVIEPLHADTEMNLNLAVQYSRYGNAGMNA
jgi:mannose-1-phosphate guanylyltransferase